MSITKFSTNAADNGNRLASGTMLEGMSPSQINDGVRSLMASIRQQHNEAEWIEHGTGNDVVNYTRVSSNSVSMPVDVTNIFTVNRRVKIIDGGNTTLYGRVTSVSFSSPNSTLIFDLDNSSTLGSGNPTSVKYGIIGSLNTSLPSLVPTGTIQMYGGATAPTGYLFCDGTTINRNTYSDLFAIIAENYGSGNGSSTFTLPNLQEKFPLGKSSAKALGSSGGSFTTTPTGTNSTPTFTGNAFTPSGSVSVAVNNHTLTESQMPSHSHYLFGNHSSTGGIFKRINGNDTGASVNTTASLEYYQISGSDDFKYRIAYSSVTPSVHNSSTEGSSSAHNHGASGTFSGASTTPIGTVSVPTFTGDSIDTTNSYQVVNYIIKY